MTSMLGHPAGINIIRQHTKARKSMYNVSVWLRTINSGTNTCIDLIFTSQPNLAMESGVHSSLHQNCHHQLIYAKINLKEFSPPPYERYWRANVDLIQRVNEQFSGEKIFRNLNINEVVLLFTKLLKIFFQASFPMKQSLVMTDIQLGLTKTSSS